MSLRQHMMRRVVEPAAIRYYQWRGDPLARLMRPQTKTDPYPLYADIRRRGLVRSALGPWMTADHAAAESILRDRRFSSSPVHQRGYRPPAYPAGDPRAELPAADLLTMDPPDHTRIRRLVSGAFTPKAIAGLEPWIREVTGRLLTSADAAAGFDLIDALAFPLPIAVICHLLGVPAEDQASFRAWGHDVGTTLDSAGTVESQSRSSELALTAYLRDLVRKRRADPDDSLLSALVAAKEEGDRLSSDELVSTALLLLVAGFETTVNLIGNGTVALLGEQEQWGRLREEPALVPAAVEELLRYDSPVQMTSRIATEDIDVGGVRIPRARRSSWPSAVPTVIPACSTSPTASGSTGRMPRGTCRSRSGSITASAPRSPASRAASRSRSSCAGTRGSKWPGRLPGGRFSCCAASRASPSAPVGPLLIVATAAAGRSKLPA